MSSTDSADVIFIASLCPEMYGPVVFRARSLYTTLYHDLPVWNDDSCLTVDTSYFAGRKMHNTRTITQDDAVQQYAIFPNPNDENITIRQIVDDNEPIKIEVFDVVGQLVYSNLIIFEEGVYRLQLPNINQGMYLLNITDDKERKFMFKFVVE